MNTHHSQGSGTEELYEEEVIVNLVNLNPLDMWLIIMSAVVVVLIAGLVWLSVRKRKTAALRQKFGSEYNLAVLVHGSERKAEAKLEDREKRVEKLTIRDLTEAEHERFAQQWDEVQARFVDSPKGAVLEADDLVCALMDTCGYPVANFDQRAADISVIHPQLVENYRLAHATTTRAGKLEANTDELRAAMIHYRALYGELMQDQPTVVLKMRA